MITYNNCVEFKFIPGLIELINNSKKDNNLLSLKLNKQKINDYKIVSYNKSTLTNENIPIYGLCRSIVVNLKNKVVSFSPPKSIRYDVFTHNFPVKNDNIHAEEFIEGTMINVFWDPDKEISGAWEISTKNIVGADTTFFKCDNSKTFKEMFIEAALLNNLHLDILNKQLCYTFVLQHPNNKIVIPINQPQLYLVAVNQIINIIDENNYNTITNAFVYTHDIENVKTHGEWSWTGIKFPKIYNDWNNYSDLIHTYGSDNTHYTIQGIVIYNKLANQRCKIRNPNYEIIRKLRGNQPKLQYQYLILRKEGKLTNYLYYYPEHNNYFKIINDNINLFIRELYYNYKNRYIKKENVKMETPFKYKTHIFNLHNIYLNDLKINKKYVTLETVIKYINDLHPSQLMFSLNSVS